MSVIDFNKPLPPEYQKEGYSFKSSDNSEVLIWKSHTVFSEQFDKIPNNFKALSLIVWIVIWVLVLFVILKNYQGVWKIHNKKKIYSKPEIGKRIAAFLIDDIISFFILAPSLFLIPFIKTEDSKWLFIVVFFILLSSIYRLTKDGWWEGQSIGKKKMNLMVVNVFDHKPCWLWRSFFRQIVRSVFFLVDVIMLLFSSTWRTLSDMIVGTQVINKNSIK